MAFISTVPAVRSLLGVLMYQLHLDVVLLLPRYMRGGKQKDHEDPRSAALLNLAARLPEMSTPPKALLLENVVGFESSECRRRLIESLERLDYSMAEFILSPIDFGIPNDRQRYYLAAVRRGLSREGSYLSAAPAIYRSWPPNSTGPRTPCRPISDYLLEPLIANDLLVPAEWILPRHGFAFDLVRPSETKTSAFTSSYATHFVIGTGSYLNPSDLPYDFKKPETLLPLQLRHFSPEEIARLHHFPLDAPVPGGGATRVPDGAHRFSFPDDLSRRIRYRAIGNSLNVEVVGTLIRDVLYGPFADTTLS